MQAQGKFKNSEGTWNEEGLQAWEVSRELGVCAGRMWGWFGVRLEEQMAP